MCGTTGAPIDLTRRKLVNAGVSGLVAGGALAHPSAGLAQAAPHSRTGAKGQYVPHPRAPQYRFGVDATTLNPDGRKAVAGVTVNGQFPA